jgi:hypothetical protein
LEDTLINKFERTQFSNHISENIQEVDTNTSIKLCDYRANLDKSKTYIFGIDKQNGIIKAKKLTF